MDRGRIWTVAIFLFLFGGAAAMQARGPILVHLEQAFGVSEAALGLVHLQELPDSPSQSL